MSQEKFISFVQQIVLNFLEKNGLLTFEWHYGKVAGVNEDGTLHIHINGSHYITPNVPANPDVIFSVDDYVWVQYVNRNPNNLFVPYKRYVKSNTHVNTTEPETEKTEPEILDTEETE